MMSLKKILIIIQQFALDHQMENTNLRVVIGLWRFQGFKLLYNTSLSLGSVQKFIRRKISIAKLDRVLPSKPRGKPASRGAFNKHTTTNNQRNVSAGWREGAQSSSVDSDSLIGPQHHSVASCLCSCYLYVEPAHQVYKQ